MKIDGALLTPDLALVPDRVRELEEAGFDGCFSFEGPHEPFMPLLLAAEHSRTIEVATGLAIAFARTPMTVANLAHDLQHFSKGRFILGLGSQIRPHIEARYSMPWSKPASRMKEFVRALRAIFACWNDEAKLDFRGEFYTHTLMPPLFNPGPFEHGIPPILLGGVGPKMTETAGEVADGFLVHPFHSRAFLDTLTIPALKRGLATSGKTLSDFTVAIQTLIIIGEDDSETDMATEMTRNQIAFYASTPGYRHVLEAEGWGELQPELRQMTKEGRWHEMSDRITDEMLDRIAFRGTPKEIAAKLRDRYGKLANRIAFASPYPMSPLCSAEIIRELKSP